MTTTRKVVLTQRPRGVPKETDFALVEADLKELEAGEVLLKVEHLSIDAFIRTITGISNRFHLSSPPRVAQE